MRFFELVIFDCDGVLVDTESITGHVLSTYLAEYDVVLSPEEFETRYAGSSLGDTKQELEGLGHVLPDDFVVSARAHLLEALSLGVDPIPGIHTVLETLSMPYCVASSGKPVKIQQSLRLANLLDKFESHMFSAYEVGFYKPDPRLFLHAAKSMSVLPTKTLVVEDSPVGVQAGVAANMVVVAYVGGGVNPSPRIVAERTTALQALGAHYILNDMHLLTEILENHE